MKIDPATGKTYSLDWGRDLSLIHQAGFSYGYSQVHDQATGKHFWRVDAMSGEGPRVVAVEMPTLAGAL